ncbi:MAG: phosphohistidine phosphatase SixA [Gammaproteobacteria bacterium]|nr:phosphohistidine phosphatase SixA [Gammaproteobacteria bacterium]
MIKAYFVQHGIATDKEVDERRPLTDKGEREVIQMAIVLKNQKIPIHKIVHSGKLRAEQTADIFSRILEVNHVSQIKGLNPKDAPETLIQQMTDDAVMYIGHLPNLEKVVSTLLANTQEGVIKFKNSAVACVSIMENDSQLQWFITPELCQ